MKWLTTWLVGEFVERDRIAIAAARGLRNGLRRNRTLWRGEIPARQQIVVPPIAARRVRARAVGVAPDLVVPIDDPTLGGDRRPGAHHHGRTVGLPSEFILAHPLHAYRAALDCARQGRGVERHVVRAIVAVAAGAFPVDAAYRGLVEP
jgi:hypothetical protein